VKRLLTVIYSLFLLHLSLYCHLDAASNVSAFQLTNGLRVILAPSNRMDAVCVLLYHVHGVRDDPPELQGASYLFQNLVLRNTENLDSFERLIYIKRSGGIGNRLVNYDFSTFSITVPASEVSKALWLESERIGSLRLTTPNINDEKNKLYNRQKRSNTNLNLRALRWVNDKVFQGTVYQLPVYGKLEEIRSFDAQKIKRLYNKFRNLSTAVLVVSGRFSEEQIRSAISKHFSSLVSPAKTAVKRFEAIAPRSEYIYKNWVVDSRGESFVMFGFRAPPKLSHDHLYFNFLRYYLLDERIFWLNKVLNKDHKLGVKIVSHYTNNFEVNSLVIKISTRNRVNLERAKYFVKKLLTSLSKGRPGTISSSNIKAVKTLLEIEFMKKMVSLEERAVFLAENYYLSGTLKADQHYLDRIRSMNSYSIYRVARKYCDKKNRVNLNVYPK